jgi:DNA-binding HxlR family transcriptional regulator
MTASQHPHANPDCRAVSELLSRVGDKWTVLIVQALEGGPRRFNTLKRDIGGISQQMLTRTLRALERDGMIVRQVHPTVPPSVEYALTPLGRSLAVPVLALADWAFAHLPQIHANQEAYDAARRAIAPVA